MCLEDSGHCRAFAIISLTIFVLTWSSDVVCHAKCLAAFDASDRYSFLSGRAFCIK